MLMGVMGTGTYSGQQAIEKSYAAEFASEVLPNVSISLFSCMQSATRAAWIQRRAAS